MYGLLPMHELKMAGHSPKSFCWFIDQDTVKAYNHAKMSKANIQSSYVNTNGQ